MLLEQNNYLSQNQNKYVQSEKVHFNLKKYHDPPQKTLNNHSKPNYLRIDQTIPHKVGKNSKKLPELDDKMDNTMVVSARKGWLTVNDQGINRKNAPQVL